MAASIRGGIEGSIDQKLEGVSEPGPSNAHFRNHLRKLKLRSQNSRGEPLKPRLSVTHFIRNLEPPNLDQRLVARRPDVQALYPACAGNPMRIRVPTSAPVAAWLK